MNNYAAYIKERENKEIIFNELGFLTYKITEKECFLADMFIQKESRGSHAVSWFISQLEAKAKQAGCDQITATIDLRDQGANRTLRASQKLDFKIIHANGDVLLISKGVNHG